MKPSAFTKKYMSAMCHKRRHRTAPQQTGFAIVSAIFLLVVLAALGGFMLTFSSVQQTTVGQDVLGVRAYQAARTGIEWGAYQIVNGGPSCVASTTLGALNADLAPYTVVVTCTTFTPANENGAAVTMYQITSTATRGAVGTPLYVERRLTATL